MNDKLIFDSENNNVNFTSLPTYQKNLRKSDWRERRSEPAWKILIYFGKSSRERSAEEVEALREDTRK